MRVLGLIMLAIMLASFAMADTLVIEMKNGKVYSLDTNDIEALKFSMPDTSGLPEMSASIDVSGSYSYAGKISMATQSGDKLRIEYDPSDGALLVGKVRGKTIKGFWIENSSGKKCSTAKDGRYFWGKTVLKVQQNGDLSGVWGYCTDKPSQAWVFKKQ